MAIRYMFENIHTGKLTDLREMDEIARPCMTINPPDYVAKLLDLDLPAWKMIEIARKGPYEVTTDSAIAYFDKEYAEEGWTEDGEQPDDCYLDVKLAVFAMLKDHICLVSW